MRHVFQSLACLCLLLCASVSFAEQLTPRAAIQTSIDKVLKVLSSPDYQKKENRPALRKEIENYILEIFDFNEFSARTVGVNWKSFSPDQQKRFTDAFAALLRNTYLERLDGYNGEGIKITGEAQSSKGDKAEVETSIVLKDKKTIPVAYRMLLKNGQWYVYDVIVEGMSWVKNYRTQFQDALIKGSPDELITRVLERAEEMRSKLDTRK